MPFFRTKSGDSGQEVTVTVTNRTVMRILGMVLLFILLLAGLRQAGQAIVLIFTAFFLALALNAPVHWLAEHLPGKKRGNRTLATVLSVVFVLALLAGFLGSVIPPIARQSTTLVENVPRFVRDLRSDDSEIGQLVQRYNLESQVDSVSQDVANYAKNAASALASTVANIGSSAVALLTILVLTFMMLAEGPRWVRLAQRLAPDEERERVRRLGTAMYNVVKGYVNGQVLLAAIASLAILPVLLLTGVDFPFALVGIVFVCGLIPMVGHTIGAIIVSLVALLNSPLAALIVLGYYILYQQIENYTVQPRVQASSTNMSPLLVFAAVVLGVGFGGLLGGLVAIPIMGCIRIILLDYLNRRGILTDAGTEQQLADAESDDPIVKSKRRKLKKKPAL